MRDREEVLDISELILDEELYPRVKTSWMTAYTYSQAMKMGDIFPPVVVGEMRGKYYLIDGWHRVQALQLLGIHEVKAIVKSVKTRKELFAEAVKLNVTHGKPLSIQDKVRIIDKLEEMGFDKEKISEIVKIPLDKLEKYKARTITLPTGKKIYLKAITAKAVEKKLKSEGESVDVEEVDQEIMNAPSVEHLLKQLIDLLEADLIPLGDNKIRELAVKAYHLLRERLELTALSSAR